MQEKVSPGKLTLWDVKTGQLTTVLTGHTLQVTSVAFSPDGTTLATGSEDELVRLWDMKRGQPRATLREHQRKIKAIAFSPDCLTVATGSEDATVRLWDMKTGQLKHTLRGHNNMVHSVAFSPDGSTLASGSGGFGTEIENKPAGEVWLWDVKTGASRAFPPIVGGWVMSVAFSPDGLTLATGTGGRDVYANVQGEVQLWDVKTAQRKTTLTGHSNWVLSLTFSPDGQTLLSGSGGDDIFFGSRWLEVRQWEVKTGQSKTVLALERLTNPVTAIAFSPDATVVATGDGQSGEPGEVKVWDVKTGQPVVTFRGHTGSISSVGFSPDGLTLASGSRVEGEEKAMTSGEVRLWDLGTRQLATTVRGCKGRVDSVAFSPDGHTLATGTDSAGLDARGNPLQGELRLWDLKESQPVATLQGHKGTVFSVAVSPDGLTLASVSGGGESGGGLLPGEVRLWDLKEGRPGAGLRGDTAMMTCVSFSPDGLTLATGTGGGKDAKGTFVNGDVRLWDVRTGQPKATLTGHKGWVTSLAFSPDGVTLATGSGGTDAQGKALPGEVRLWDIMTRRCGATLGGQSWVSSVAFAPDGITLASSGEGPVRLWKVKTALTELILPGYTDRVTSVAFSRDGERVYGWDREGKVLAWKVKDGQPADASQPPPRSSAKRVTSPDYGHAAEARHSAIAIVKLTSIDSDQEYQERTTLEETNRIPWHQCQAAQAELNKEWFAASFHLGQLLKVKPDDALKRRHTDAIDKLNRVNDK